MLLIYLCVSSNPSVQWTLRYINPNMLKGHPALAVGGGGANMSPRAPTATPTDPGRHTHRHAGDKPVILPRKTITKTTGTTPLELHLPP